MRWLIYVATALVLVPLGYLLRYMISEGHWPWFFPAWFLLVVALGYLVSGPDERAEFRQIWRRLTGWARR